VRELRGFPFELRSCVQGAAARLFDKGQIESARSSNWLPSRNEHPRQDPGAARLEPNT